MGNFQTLDPKINKREDQRIDKTWTPRSPWIRHPPFIWSLYIIYYFKVHRIKTSVMYFLKISAPEGNIPWYSLVLTVVMFLLEFIEYLICFCHLTFAVLEVFFVGFQLWGAFLQPPLHLLVLWFQRFVISMGAQRVGIAVVADIFSCMDLMEVFLSE